MGEPKYFKNGEMLLYRDKKSKKAPVALLSINNNTKTMVVTKKRGQYESEKEKPHMIDHYNKYIGGVDEFDKMLYVYLDERRTLKY